MNSPAHDVAMYLKVQGVGALPYVVGAGNGWALSLALEPDEPGTAVTIYDTGGMGPDTDEMDMQRATIQVRVRGPVYPVAYDKQREIRKLLLTKANIVSATSEIFNVIMTSDILAIGRDDKNRHVLTANYQIHRIEKE